MKFRFCGDLDCPDWVLAEIATLSQMSSTRIRVIASQILSQCLVGQLNYDKIMKLSDESAEGISDIKGALAAINFLLTNAAKYDVDDISFMQEVLQLGLPKENTDAVTKLYRENKEALQTKFGDDSYRVSKLVSADWRVDHIIASNLASDTDSIVSVKLKIDTKPELGSLDTSASQRLKDIAFELNDQKLSLLIHELTQAKKILEEN